jgi:hypothetical protein
MKKAFLIDKNNQKRLQKRSFVFQGMILFFLFFIIVFVWTVPKLCVRVFSAPTDKTIDDDKRQKYPVEQEIQPIHENLLTMVRGD